MTTAPGVLQRWARECAAGIRTPNDPTDALWSAVWRQKAAFMWEQLGDPRRAVEYRAAAAKIMARANSAPPSEPAATQPPSWEQAVADWLASSGAPTSRASVPAVRSFPECGAHVQWGRELRAGARTKYDPDPPWRAACLECRARDCLRDGQLSAANDDRSLAAEIILEAAMRKTSGRGRAA